MDRDWSSGGTRERLHAHDGRLDGVENAAERLLLIAEFETVLPSQVVGDRQREFDFSVVPNFHLRNRLLLLLESIPAYPASHVSLPEEIQRRLRGKTFATKDGMRANRALRRTDAQLSIRNLDFGAPQQIGLVFLNVCVRRRRSARRRVEGEVRARQVSIGRLRKVEITLPLPSRIEFYEMIADGSRGQKTRNGRAA